MPADARLEAQRLGRRADDGELSRLVARHGQYLRSETSGSPTQVCPPNGYAAFMLSTAWPIPDARGRGRGLAALVMSPGAGPAGPPGDDPFDRLLIVQARHEGLTIVTADPVFEAYGVSVLDARG